MQREKNQFFFFKIEFYLLVKKEEKRLVQNGWYLDDCYLKRH